MKHMEETEQELQKMVGDLWRAGPYKIILKIGRAHV